MSKNKGRLVLSVWKSHPADPYFWILLQGVSEPYKVYYGREGWNINLRGKETRAKYAVDHEIKDGATRVISSIDIAGPKDEIIKLIQLACYDGCGASAMPRYLCVPKTVVAEVSQYIPTRELLSALRKNDPSALLAIGWQFLDRATRYDNCGTTYVNLVKK